MTHKLQGRTYGSSDYEKILSTFKFWGSRFWSKVDDTSSTGCWNWKAGTNDKGYGVFGVYKRLDHRKAMKLEYAHRLMWMLFNEEVPEGYVVDHKCFNPQCCNPDHLQVIPQYENCKQHVRLSRKTHCGTCGEKKVACKSKSREFYCQTCSREQVKKCKQKVKSQKLEAKGLLGPYLPKGVTFIRSSGRFRATKCLDYKKFSVGVYTTPSEAYVQREKATF